MTALPLVLLAVLDLGTLFGEKDAWTETAEFFAVEHAKEGFAFASEARDIVNCLKHDTCTWHGLRVWETKVYFDKDGEEEKVRRVELSLYNRGDAGLAVMDLAALKAAVAAVSETLAPGEKKVKPEKTQLSNGSVQYRRPFDKATPPAELVWGKLELSVGIRKLRTPFTRFEEHLQFRSVLEPKAEVYRHLTREMMLYPAVSLPQAPCVYIPVGRIEKVVVYVEMD